MAEQDKKLSAFVSTEDVGASDLAMVAIVDQQEESGFSSRRVTLANLARCFLNVFQFPLLFTKTTAKTVIGSINEIGFFELTDTLEAGETELTIEDAKILATSTVDIFTSEWGISPENVEVSEGEVVLTFEALEDDIDVKVRVY